MVILWCTNLWPTLDKERLTTSFEVMIRSTRHTQCYFNLAMKKLSPIRWVVISSFDVWMIAWCTVDRHIYPIPHSVPMPFPSFRSMMQVAIHCSCVGLTHIPPWGRSCLPKPFHVGYSKWIDMKLTGWVLAFSLAAMHFEENSSVFLWKSIGQVELDQCRIDTTQIILRGEVKKKCQDICLEHYIVEFLSNI